MNKSETLKTNEPLLFKEILDWKILKWTEKNWRDFLENDDTVIPIRKGSFECSKEPHWERKSVIENMTMAQFLTLIFASNEEPIPENWYYFDYKHIPLWFKENIEKLDFCWKCVGFPEKKAEDSTIWIGTKGAHTPCHIDTYGCNFIAQLYGSKTWLLFSPSETDKLRPTRVPYEESSIYSDFNYFCKCNNFPDVKEAKVVTLEPGDVLYVPKKWWHYVQNETSAISINTWIPMGSDDEARIEESLVKCFISSFTKSLKDADVQSILNPNEDDLADFTLSQSIEELNWCLNKLRSTTESDNSQNDNLLRKYSLKSLGMEEIKQQLKINCLINKKKKNSSPQEVSISYKEIINAFCHPDVIKLVSEKIKSNRFSND